MPDGHDRSLDFEFKVPFTHRLRVTQEVASADYAQLAELLEHGEAGPAKVLLIAEAPVAEASPRVAKLSDRLNATPDVQLVRETFIVPGGEVVKNSSAVVDQVLDQINQHNLDRRSYVIAVGGGAMLDAIGYAAAIAHRGIRLIRLPTTTLAQADSGVGVKNAINRFKKKNWIGSFAVPWGVINDSGLLQTLPDRDFRSGFSEAVKVSLLKNSDDFDWLCENAAQIRDRDVETSNLAIHRSCLLHLRHITQGGDPFEMLEARPLDFGHWSAHRLEPLTDYQLRHGEAVGIGVAIDCFYSSLMFGFPKADAKRVFECMHTMGLPLWHEELYPIERLMAGLEEFRQHLGGRLTITMLRSVGDPIDVHDIDLQKMESAILMLKDLADK